MAQRQYPVVKDSPDRRDHLAAPPGIVLPSSADLSAWLGPVKDQGQLGSCTGFAFAGLREFIYRKFTQYEKTPTPTPVFSPLFLYYEERLIEGDVGQDGGAQSRSGLWVLANTGVCLETSDPYNPSEFTSTPTANQVSEAMQFKIGAYQQPSPSPLRCTASLG